MRDFWEWDQTTNLWTKKADYPGNSVGGAVGFSIGSKGYIGTGYTITVGYTNEFWEYDPATNTWTEKASLPGTLRSYAVGFSIGIKGYIGTGVHVDDLENYSFCQDLWEWDQSTNLWTRKADIGGLGRYAAVGFSIGTKGYIGTGDASKCSIFQGFLGMGPGNKHMDKESRPGRIRQIIGSWFFNRHQRIYWNWRHTRRW